MLLSSNFRKTLCLCVEDIPHFSHYARGTLGSVMIIVTFNNLFNSIKSTYTCAINLPQTLKHSTDSLKKPERVKDKKRNKA